MKYTIMRMVIALKRFAAGILCRPLMGRALAGIFCDRIPHKGFRIDTSHPSITPLTKAALFWGGYEGAEIRFTRRYLRPDLDVVELGCSIGVLSCHIRRQMESARQLVCVEALPELAEITRKNLRINDCENNVSVIERAIDYDKERKHVSLEVGVENTGGRIIDYKACDGRRTIEIQTTTLCEILSEAGIGEYSLVSDIEGAEAGFIMEKCEDLSKCQRIIIELHDTSYRYKPVTVEDMVQRLVHVHGFALADQYGRCYVFEKKG